MSTAPIHLSRAPNLLFSRAGVAQATRTHVSLFGLQSQMATGRAILRPSDDAVKAAAISSLDQRLDRTAQRLRNIDHASTNLNALDTALREIGDIAQEGKSIASAQISFGSSPQERRAQALVVDSLLDSLYRQANSKGQAGHLFGGSAPGRPPVEGFLGGYRFTAAGSGLTTDLADGLSIPITLGASSIAGTTSARVRGTADLDPPLTGDTRLTDVAGGRSLGVALGPIEFSFDGGPRATVDLSGADTAQDVAEALTTAIRRYEADEGVTILGPGGISFSGGSLALDVVPASSGPDPDLEFFEVGSGVAGRDLGLVREPAAAFNASSPDGADLGPRLTWRTGIDGLSVSPLGAIRISNAGRSVAVDLSGAETLGDVRDLIHSARVGVRVEINEAGTGINVVNEVAAGRGAGLAIEEVAGGGLTATGLGIRTFSPATRLADFNDGRGVRIADGATDPVTGLPDPAKDTDFSITLGDGSSFTVDLRPQDLTDVGTVIARINAAAAGAGITVPDDFEATLTDGGNGLALVQSDAFPNPITVAKLNGSHAAADLGLAGATYDAGSATLRGEDRANVRVQSLFTALIDLRDALLNDDTDGIALAAGSLEARARDAAEVRGTVGAWAQRLENERVRQEDMAVLDEKTRSELRDLDYTDAAVRLGLLQTQLQAGLQAMARASSLSLLDFLG